MKLLLGTGVLALTCALIAGRTDGEACDTGGDSSTYSEAFVNTQFNVRNWRRQIQASGCPNHNNVKTSAGHDAQTQNHDISIPANPSLEAGTDRQDLTNSAETIGITLNGVAILSCFSDGNGQCTDLASSAVTLEANTIDECGGHSDPDGM